VAEDKVRQNRNIEIAKNAIIKGAEDAFIADITGLTLDQIEEIRTNLPEK
jgi:ribosomal protein L10